MATISRRLSSQTLWYSGYFAVVFCADFVAVAVTSMTSLALMSQPLWCGRK